MEKKETANTTFQSPSELFSVSAIGRKTPPWHSFHSSRLRGPECSIRLPPWGVSQLHNCLQLKTTEGKVGSAPVSLLIWPFTPSNLSSSDLNGQN